MEREQKTEVQEPEVVVDLMPWYCAGCGHKWQDRKDGKGVSKRGCPNCGSARVMDCNVSAVVSLQPATGEALKACPFCGQQPKMHPYKGAPAFTMIECVSPLAACGVYCYTVGKTQEQAIECWNRRSPSGRDEFVQIIERLKQRGLITEEDAVQARAGLEVAHG